MESRAERENTIGHKPWNNKNGTSLRSATIGPTAGRIEGCRSGLFVDVNRRGIELLHE